MTTTPSTPSDPPPPRDFREDPAPHDATAADAGAHGTDHPDQHEPDHDQTAAAGREENPLRITRISGAWLGLAVLAIALVLVIVFIAQNTASQPIEFLGWSGSAPVAVSLLAAFVAGLLIAAVAGTLRIWQLRRRVKTLDKKLR